MANNRNHPVHLSHLVACLRKTLMPHITRKEWNEMLVNLRVVYDLKKKHRDPFYLDQHRLLWAFRWADSPKGSLYWAELDNKTR